MLRLIHCKSQRARLCWSRTYDVDDTSSSTLPNPIDKRPKTRLLSKRFLTVFLLLITGTNQAVLYFPNPSMYRYCQYGQYHPQSPLGLLLTLTSGNHRDCLKVRNLCITAQNIPNVTGKRRRGSESDVIGSPQARRREIKQTTKREGRKRKWVDDLDGPSAELVLFRKKPRFNSFQLADLDWSAGTRRSSSSERKSLNTQRYLYSSIPRRPPWYTSRVCKRYAGVGNRRKRSVRYLERQIQGMEDFLSKDDPPFNAFCVDGLREAVPTLSDAAVRSTKPAAARPRTST